jgi:hypothetical protein
VARYVRLALQAERPGVRASFVGEVRQLEDRLGLTPRAMKYLQWVIAPDDVEEQPSEPGAVTDLKRYRDRLTGSG